MIYFESVCLVHSAALSVAYPGSVVFFLAILSLWDWMVFSVVVGSWALFSSAEWKGLLLGT